jgi:hypothetical protein
VSSLLSRGGLAVKAGGLALKASSLAEIVLANAAPTHLWDAADAVTYAAGADGYGLSSATRVDHVPDRGTVGGLPAHIDDGTWAAVVPGPPDNGAPTLGRLPGPVYSASSTRFRGRPCWSHDVVLATDTTHYPNTFLFNNVHSTLSPEPTHTNSNNDGALGLSQPWWFAALCAFPPGVSGNQVTCLDGNPSTVTVGAPPGSAWTCAAWRHDFIEQGRLTSTVLGSTSRTFLALGCVNTTASSFTVVTRDNGGGLVQNTQTGTMGADGSAIGAMHLGWSDITIFSMLMFGSGVAPTAALIAALGPFIALDGA